MKLSQLTLSLFLLLTYFSSLAQESIHFNKKLLFEIAIESYQEKLRLAKYQIPDYLLKDVQKESSFRIDQNFNLSGSTDAAESEIHAAVNPLDSNNIVIANMNFTSEASALSIDIYYTLDRGISWQKSNFRPLEESFQLLSTTLGGGDPVLAFNNKGEVILSFLTWTIDILGLGSFTRMHTASSLTKGRTWTYDGIVEEASQIEFFGETDNKFLDKEWLAFDNSESATSGNLYMSYTEIDLADTSYHIYLERRLNNQTQFLQERTDITKDEFIFAQYATLAVDDEGIVHLAFMGVKEELSFLKLWYTQSIDGGQTFSDPLEITDLAIPCFPNDPNTPCEIIGFGSRLYPAPILAVDNSNAETRGNIYIAWNATPISDIEMAPNLNIFMTASYDNGRSWSTPNIVTDIKGRDFHQYYPSLFVNNKGQVLLSWYDRRNDPNNIQADYYMSYSTNGARTFEENEKLSLTSTDFSTVGLLNGGFGIGEYNQILGIGCQAIPFWADGRSGDGNLDIYTGIFDLGCSLITGIREIRSLALEIEKVKIYPNPIISHSFNLSYHISKNQKIDISIIDSSGKIIRHLFSGKQTKGVKQHEFTIDKLQSGLYYVKIVNNQGKIAYPINIVRF